MRLFVAVKFSDEMIASLCKAINDLRSRVISGNFTRPENLHLTLAFIGETMNIDGAKRAVGSINARGFDIKLRGAGNFGSLYWVGLEQSRPLADLARDVRAALRGEGFGIEEREFSPHITIAREVAAESRPGAEAGPAGMRVGRVSLMKSERIGGRLIYTEIFWKELA